MATAEQRQAFAEVLQQALRESRMSQRALARTLGLAQTSVSKWLRGQTAPRPETAARVEGVLEVDPGALSRLLGYVVVAHDGRAVGVSEAVRADPRLGPREQAVVLAVYRELVRQYGAADKAAAGPRA